MQGKHKRQSVRGTVLKKTLNSSPPSSLKEAGLVGLSRAILATACAAVVLTLAGHTPASIEFQPGETGPTSSSFEAEIVDLMDTYNCWDGSDGTKRPIPGHVLYSRPEMDLPRIGGQRLTSQALDQQFAGKEHGLTIHAFCV